MSRVNIIFLGGFLWGVIEASFGGVAHLFHLPFIGYFMATVGFAVMYQLARHPSDAMGIAAIAAMLKFSDALVFHIPSIAPQIANPVMAILLQGLVFSAVWALSRRESSLMPVLYPYLSFGLFIPAQLFIMKSSTSYAIQYHIVAATIMAAVCFAVSKAARPQLTINRRFAYVSTFSLFIIAVATKVW